ncbi:MAG: metalloregulator ArsR/SmtB family transcription factor [Devosiaceae bacterium]|nr:metalloregulator ArsR/SmtB family transcription factor [Devosiaceae bacterium]
MLDLPEKTAEVDANNMDINALEEKASDIAVLLKAMGNERRLVILCQLVAQGEMSVGAMVEKIGLGQSALSQHLAKMRDEGIVATRRDGQTIYYRVTDGRVEELMVILHRLYCKA